MQLRWKGGERQPPCLGKADPRLALGQLRAEKLERGKEGQPLIDVLRENNGADEMINPVLSTRHVISLEGRGNPNEHDVGTPRRAEEGQLPQTHDRGRVGLCLLAGPLRRRLVGSRHPCAHRPQPADCESSQLCMLADVAVNARLYFVLRLVRPVSESARQTMGRDFHNHCAVSGTEEIRCRPSGQGRPSLWCRGTRSVVRTGRHGSGFTAVFCATPRSTDRRIDQS